MTALKVGDRVETCGRVLPIRPHTGVIIEIWQYGGPWHRMAMVRFDDSATVGVALHKLKPQDWRKHL